MVLVNIEDLQRAKRWVLLNHGVSDVHCLVVGVADASLDVGQVQGILPVEEPFLLWVSVLGGERLGLGNFGSASYILVGHTGNLADVLGLEFLSFLLLDAWGFLWSLW